MANFRDLMLRGERYLWRVMRNFMPRWTIFLFDEFIVVIAFVSLWFFRENIAATPSQHFIFKITLAASIFAITAILFRTYHGVVRFSTMVDLKRLSNSTIAATLVYTGIAVLITETDIEGDWNITFNYWFPGVLGMMVLAGQFIFRFTVEVSSKHSNSQTTQIKFVHSFWGRIPTPFFLETICWETAAVLINL